MIKWLKKWWLLNFTRKTIVEDTDPELVRRREEAADYNRWQRNKRQGNCWSY